MKMDPDELLTRIRLPRQNSKCLHYYRKVGTRKAQAISKVCIAAIGRKEDERIGDVRIAFGSVAPIVIRCAATEAAIRGKPLGDSTIKLAQESLVKEIVPIDDIRSTSAYRLGVARNLLVDFLNCLQSF
jgi:CO/xanthine dehydrogenase FAD-binding subunit